MKATILLLITSLFLISCSSDDNNSNNLIGSYNKIYMHNSTNSNPLISNNYNIDLEYNSNGKPSNRIDNNGVIEVYDEIIYSGNSVRVEKKINHEFYTQADNERIFYINNQGNIERKVFYDLAENIYNITEVNYFYDNEDKIERAVSTLVDSNGNAYTESLYYFNNDKNLDSIVTRSYQDYSDGNGFVSWGRTVESFSDYDTADNPLKHLGVFDEIFLRTLSENNYTKYSKNTYDDDGNIMTYINNQWDFYYDESGRIRYDLF